MKEVQFEKLLVKVVKAGGSLQSLLDAGINYASGYPEACHLVEGLVADLHRENAVRTKVNPGNGYKSGIRGIKSRFGSVYNRHPK